MYQFSVLVWKEEKDAVTSAMQCFVNQPTDVSIFDITFSLDIYYIFDIYDLIKIKFIYTQQLP